MILRFKLKSGGKINLVVTSVAFFNETDGQGTTITMNNGFAHEVEESAQTVRGAFKRLSKNEDTNEA